MGGSPSSGQRSAPRVFDRADNARIPHGQHHEPTHGQFNHVLDRRERALHEADYGENRLAYEGEREGGQYRDNQGLNHKRLPEYAGFGGNLRQPYWYIPYASRGRQGDTPVPTGWHREEIYFPNMAASSLRAARSIRSFNSRYSF